MTTAAPPVTSSDVVRRALTRQGVDWAGAVFAGLLLFALIFTLGVLIVLVADVLRGAIPLYQERGLDFLTGSLSSSASRTGISQAIRGSLTIAAFVAVVAFPLGIAAAVWLEEYAPDNPATRFVALNIRNLAGVPSIVYGILGLSILVQALGGLTGGRSVISAGLTLAILVLPIVIITSAEAIRAVPDSIREAGYGVGATQWEVIRSHVLPYAAPGILTGTVLSLGRALGEAAPLILVGAVTGFLQIGGDPGFFGRLQQRFVALPTTIADFAGQPQREFVDLLTPAAILALIVIVLLTNSFAIFLRNRYDKSR